MQIKVIGMDPSLSNWGIAHALVDIDTLEVEIGYFQLIETEPTKVRMLRKSNDDLERARLLRAGMALAQNGAVIAFVEVPHGSQSARAMASYGVCIGVLASCDTPMVELTASEVKMAAVGRKEAGKEEMIKWATTKHPKAPWPMRGGKIVAGKAEHLADAVAAIYAGIKNPQFEATLRILRATRPNITTDMIS